MSGPFWLTHGDLIGGDPRRAGPSGRPRRGVGDMARGAARPGRSTARGVVAACGRAVDAWVLLVGAARRRSAWSADPQDRLPGRGVRTRGASPTHLERPGRGRSGGCGSGQEGAAVGASRTPGSGFDRRSGRLRSRRRPLRPAPCPGAGASAHPVGVRRQMGRPTRRPSSNCAAAAEAGRASRQPCPGVGRGL